MSKKKTNKKQKRTLKTMKNNRKKDDKNLRAKITDKLDWVEEQLKKAEELIERYKEELEITKIKKQRLQGAKLTLKNLINKE